MRLYYSISYAGCFVHMKYFLIKKSRRLVLLLSNMLPLNFFFYRSFIHLYTFFIPNTRGINTTGILLPLIELPTNLTVIIISLSSCFTVEILDSSFNHLFNFWIYFFCNVTLDINKAIKMHTCITFD